MQVRNLCSEGFVLYLIPLHYLVKFSVELVATVLFIQRLFFDLVQQLLQRFPYLIEYCTFFSVDVHFLRSLVTVLPRVSSERHTRNRQNSLDGQSRTSIDQNHI